MTICRLSREKNIYEIIQAISEVKREIYLYIVGNGPEKKKISNFIRSMHLEKKIKLIGYKNNPYDHLIQADLYINSSYFEGFQIQLLRLRTLVFRLLLLKVTVELMKFYLKEKAERSIKIHRI